MGLKESDIINPNMDIMGKACKAKKLLIRNIQPVNQLTPKVCVYGVHKQTEKVQAMISKSDSTTSSSSTKTRSLSTDEEMQDVRGNLSYVNNTDDIPDLNISSFGDISTETHLLTGFSLVSGIV